MHSDEKRCTGCGVTIPAELDYPETWLHVTGPGIQPMHRCPGCAADVMHRPYDGLIRIVVGTPPAIGATS